MRRYILTDGELNLFPDGAVPEPIRVLYTARWLKGAATVEWLLAHPEWWEWADICAIAHEQAVAQAHQDRSHG